MKIHAMLRLIFPRTGHGRRYLRARATAKMSPSDTHVSQIRPANVRISVSGPAPASTPLLFLPHLPLTHC
jgi:hypothetical protein